MRFLREHIARDHQHLDQERATRVGKASREGGRVSRKDSFDIMKEGCVAVFHDSGFVGTRVGKCKAKQCWFDAAIEVLPRQKQCVE